MSFIISPTEIKHDVIVSPFVGGNCASSKISYKYDAPVPVPGNMWVPDDYFYETPKPPKDKSSWSAIKKSGAIKMTPYSRLKETVKHTPVGVQKSSFALGWPACLDGSYLGSKTIAHSTWVDWYHVNSPLASFPLKKDFSSPDLDAERNSLRATVVSDNLQTYDLLTELSEIKETAAMIMSILKSVRHPLQSFRDFSKSIRRRGDLSPKKMNEAINQKWMEYRYAIMPAYYSIRDIAKLAEERNNVYKTSRSSRKFSYTVESDIDRSQKGMFLYTRKQVNVRLSAVGKASYDIGELQLRLLDQIGLNPFVTAWELVPFSFVIDWFANIGDWVLAQTSSITDGSQQRVFCESTKLESVEQTFLFANLEFSDKRKYNDVRVGDVVAGPFPVYVDEIVCERKVQSYSRNIFTPRDVQLQLDVFLNWKRMLDAWVLGQKPIIKGLRSLK